MGFNSLQSNINVIDISPYYGDEWDMILHNNFVPGLDDCLGSVNDGLGDFPISGETFNFDLFNHILGCRIFSSPTHDGEDLELCDIGLTGVDNGFVDNLTGETLTLLSGSSFFLTCVDGYQFDYPICGLSCVPLEDLGMMFEYSYYPYLQGGFWQGFFKLHEYDYELFSPRPNGWTYEFVLQLGEDIIEENIVNNTSMPPIVQTDPEPTCLTGTTFTILNDVYTGNTGFFFYIGTRAENKFHNCFSGETGVTTCEGTPLCNLSADTATDEEDPYENSFYQGGLGPSLCCGDEEPCNPCIDPDIIDDSIICDETYDPVCGCDGNTYDNLCLAQKSGVTSWTLGICTTGTTATTDNSLCNLEYNALGFRINENRQICWRMVTGDTCSGTTGIAEDCSDFRIPTINPNSDESVGCGTIYDFNSGDTCNLRWRHIMITWCPYEDLDECLLIDDIPQRCGTLTIYYNGLRVYTKRNFLELMLKPLCTTRDKQIAVPYTISLGGGTQGLLESITFGGVDPEDRNLLLEQYFAGSFIGSIAQFRHYQQCLTALEVKNNYINFANNFGLPTISGGRFIYNPLCE